VQYQTKFQGKYRAVESSLPELCSFTRCCKLEV
jgi:hypothetical protein